MSKYVYISADGTNSLYDDDFHSQKPEGSLPISNEDFSLMMLHNGDHFFVNENGTAVLKEVTTRYVATDYGMTIKAYRSNQAIPTDGVSFDHQPTETELANAFPSIAASRMYTITANSSVGSTLKLDEVMLTCATDFAVGPDLSSTAKNIANALNAKSDFNQYYTATAVDESFLIAERIAGNQKMPGEAVCTGELTILNGALTNSTYGYKNAKKAKNFVDLNAAYAAKMYPVERAIVTAAALGNKTDGLAAILSTLMTEYKSKAEAIVNE